MIVADGAGARSDRQTRRICAWAALANYGPLKPASLGEKRSSGYSAGTSGCSAVVAHLLWEPFVPERCRLGALKRESGERKRVDYCAFRSSESGELRLRLALAPCESPP